jgi:hypothetical protein
MSKGRFSSRGICARSSDASFAGLVAAALGGSAPERSGKYAR